MIDTLEMARVIEKAGLNREGAEGFAEELDDRIDGNKFDALEAMIRSNG